MNISRIRIVLGDGKEEGKVYLQNKFGTAYDGHASTNLKAGIYEISSVDVVNKRWNIKGVTTGMKFYIIPEGVDPWRLTYSSPLLLEITTDKGDGVGSSNEEILDGIGKDAYSGDPAYIDNVKAGHYDVFTGKFTVDHEDGSTIEIDYRTLVIQLMQSRASAANTIYVYVRNKQNGKIYPKIFDANSAPNITAMVMETEEARVDAELLVKTVPFMFDLISFNGFGKAGLGGLGRATKGGAPSPAELSRIRRKVWKVVPRGSAAGTRDFLKITEDLPTANIGRPGDPDLLVSAVRAKQVSKAGEAPKFEIYYQVTDMSALGADGGKVKAAHRSLIVAAAERAKLNGQKEFRLVGKQSNANAIAHHDKLAHSIGIPGSGRKVAAGGPGFPDHEVTLVVEKVLGSNTP
ncbi:MAG TPA: hypothetical protein VNH22_13400 [Blastocatellia bacterium]|jgi:hypothetical protein|nr:hypothetical protein [Blastocatellia bacterium]